MPLILYMPGKLAGIQSEGKRKRERALQTLGDQAFLIQIPIFLFSCLHINTLLRDPKTLPSVPRDGMQIFFPFFQIQL